MASVKRSRKLYEVVIDEIRVLIEAEGLRPGDKLPTERELIDILGVSRTPLREALTVLQSEGLLEITQGRGIFVKDPRITSSDSKPHEGEPLFEMLQEARKVLECGLVELACQRATESSIVKLSQAIERISHGSDPRGSVQADYDFHYALAEAAQNHVLTDLLKQVDANLYSGRSATLSFPKGRIKAWKAHQKILEAIIQRDAPRAVEAMKNHLAEVSEAQKRMLTLKSEQPE